MTRDLFCIKDKEELAWISSGTASSAKQDFILPLMPKAALGLLDQGSRHVRLPIEFLAKSERESIYQQAIDLSKDWHVLFQNETEYKGIDLLDCCRLQMLGFFQDVIAAEMIVPRLIEEYKPTSAVFFKYPSVPSFGHSMHDGRADILNAALQWKLLQAGIDVRVKSEDIRGNKRFERIGSSLLAKVRRGINFCRRRLFPSTPGAFDPRRIKLSDLPQDRSPVVGYGGGYDLLAIWPYLKAIAAEIDGFPVLLNGAPNFDPTTLRSGLALDDDLRYLYIGDIPLAPVEGVDLKAARVACLSALENGDLLPSILQNPLLSFQFEHLWDNLVPQAACAARRATFFFAEYKPALYLDDYCAGPVNRAWIEVGNLVGVPTVNVQHGAVNLLEFFDFNAQWAFAWGELGRENFALACPEKQDSVIISGDPSMETIRAESATMPEVKRDRVLLLTGGFLHQVWTDMDLQGFISTWEEIAQIAQERLLVEFIVKPHPSVRDLGDWYRDFVKKKSIINMRVVDNEKLEKLLCTAFLSVLVGKPGTAGLVSVLAGAPFVYLDTMLCRDVPGYRIWRDENGVPRLTSSAQLAEMIDRLYSSREERNRLLEQNRRSLHMYLRPFKPLEVCKQIGLQV